MKNYEEQEEREGEEVEREEMKKMKRNQQDHVRVGGLVLSLAVSSFHQQCTVGVLIKAEFVGGVES